MRHPLWVIGGNQGIGADIADQATNYGQWDQILATGASECDVTDYASVYSYVNKLSLAVGEGLDVVYCAGYNKPGSFGDMNHVVVGNHFRVNVIGFLAVMDALVYYFGKASPINVVVICSDASRVAMRTSSAYCASKAALVQAVRCAARELAPHYRINGVSPSVVDDTPMTDYLDELIPKQRGWTKEQAREYEASLVPMKRRATKAEVTQLVIQTLNGPTFQTGSIIDITGGK